MDVIEKRQQVARQCEVVAHLASALASVHSDYMAILEAGAMDTTLDVVGERTAALMQTLGDILNDMDAVTDDDEWTAPIFEQAQLLWPAESVKR